MKVYNNALTDKAIAEVRRYKLQEVLEKFVRTLTNQRIKVSLELKHAHSMIGAPPAYSTDEAVVILHDEAKPIITADSLLRIKGLTIHETSHLLFTPKSRTDLAKWVERNGYYEAFNLLEDNRIENMMVAKMSGVRPWLIHTIVTELLNDEQTLPFAHLLVYGRKYLPQELHKTARAAWAPLTDEPGLTSAIEQLLDEYITLNLTKRPNTDRARQIISDMQGWMSKVFNDDTSRHVRPQSGSWHNSTRAQVFPESKSSVDQTKPGQQDKLLEKVKDTINEPIDEESDINDGIGTAHASNDATSTKQSNQSGEGSTPSATGDLQQVVDSIAETIESQLRSELIDTVKMLRADEDSIGDRSTLTLKTITTYKSEPVVPAIADTYHSFAKELINLKALCDPAWNRRQPQGRIDVRRFVLEDDFEEAFDLWDASKSEATDIECMVLVDVSGSMGRMLPQTYASAWAIKRALDRVQASTTVVQYGENCDILYPANSSAGVEMRTARWHSGPSSTNPKLALKYAKKVLLNSPRALKMLLIITDGVWHDNTDCNGLILQMRKAGVMTGLAFLSDVDFYATQVGIGGDLDAHFCEVAEQIDDPLALVQFARKLTHLSQQRILSN